MQPLLVKYCQNSKLPKFLTVIMVPLMNSRFQNPFKNFNGFKSTDWLGHAKPSPVILAACLRLLFCWNIHFLLTYIGLCPSTLLHLCFFSVCNAPVLSAEKQLHIILLSVPCFTASMVFLGSYAHPFFLKHGVYISVHIIASCVRCNCYSRCFQVLLQLFSSDGWNLPYLPCH